MADPARVSSTSKINDLAWKPGHRPSTDFHSVFSGLETRVTSDSRNKTAAPTGLGSGGEGDLEKLGSRSEVEFYNIGLCAAIVPRIIRLHYFGLTAEPIAGGAA